MTTQFNWTDSTIDSRDIIERYENLKGDYDELLEALEEARNTYTYHGDKCAGSVEFDEKLFDEELRELEKVIENAQEELDQFNQSFEKDEMDTLSEIIKQGEVSPDWFYGEALINSDYFVDYTKELIDDCYELPSELTSGKWPYCHINIDYESAAAQLKDDYFSIDIEDQTFYIRA
jgi:predicted nuclease with TOPRIM domain